MIVIKELLPVDRYAMRCRVKPSTIIYRHRKGSIASIKIDGNIFVDRIASPPEKFLSYHNKKPVSPVVLPENIDPKDLVSISSYAAKKKVRGDSYFILAMTGKIKSLVIGNMAFMLKQEADLIPIKHRKRPY